MAIPVSGPGPLSRRTDRQPIASVPNADYGEQKAYKQLQQDAPVAQSSGMPSGGGMDFSSLFGGAEGRVIPLGAESNMPGTPVTDGANAGPGLGLDALGIRAPQSQQDLQNLASQLPVLEFFANQPNASWALRNVVRAIKGSL